MELQEFHACTKLLLQAFAVVDADGSGKIDEVELRSAMKALGFDMTKEETRKYIRENSKDGSTLGLKVCLTEALRMLASFRDCLLLENSTA